MTRTGMHCWTVVLATLLAAASVGSAHAALQDADDDLMTRARRFLEPEVPPSPVPFDTEGYDAVMREFVLMRDQEKAWEQFHQLIFEEDRLFTMGTGRIERMMLVFREHPQAPIVKRFFEEYFSNHIQRRDDPNWWFEASKMIWWLPHFAESVDDPVGMLSRAYDSFENLSMRRRPIMRIEIASALARIGSAEAFAVLDRIHGDFPAGGNYAEALGRSENPTAADFLVRTLEEVGELIDVDYDWEQTPEGQEKRRRNLLLVTRMYLNALVGEFENGDKAYKPDPPGVTTWDVFTLLRIRREIWRLTPMLIERGLTNDDIDQALERLEVHIDIARARADKVDDD